jgi:hypothetical protein
MAAQKFRVIFTQSAWKSRRTFQEMKEGGKDSGATDVCLRLSHSRPVGLLHRSIVDMFGVEA